MAILPAGRYKARVTSAGLAEKGPNNLLCLKLMLAGVEWKNGAGEYEPIPEGNSIIGDFYLEKKPESGGGISEDMVKRLAHVFEWGGDLTTLAETANGCMCKITIKDETYNGRTSSKVSWVNHIDDGDAGGGYEVEHDDGVAKKAQARLGTKIRALLGSPATAAPAGPPRPASTAPPTSRVPVQLATAESVWDAFGKMARAELKDATNEVVQDNWFHFLKETFGTDDAAQITNWNQALVSIVDFKDKLLPF